MYADINYSKTTLTYLGEAETKMSLSSGIVLRDPSRSPEIIEFCLNYPYKYYAWNGLPRNLIRNNMKDYIPADILYNLFRHGNQNADWLHRIELEWDRIKEDIRVYIDKSYMKEYIDYNKIDEFLKNNYNSIDDDNLFVFIDLLSVVVLSKFIENA